MLDGFDINIQQKIVEREKTKEPYSKFYLENFNKERSDDNARKCLYGINDYLSLKSEEDDAEFEINEQIDKAKQNYKETSEICQDGSYKSDKLLEMSENDLKDVDFMLKAHGFDNNGLWELVSAKNNIWNVYSKQDGISTLYSSKITVKPITPVFKVEWVKDIIANTDFKNVELQKRNYDNLNQGKVVEINFADAHLGKFVTETVSDGNYNIDIAVDRYEKAINDAIIRTSIFNKREILFVVGQDFMNIDNLENSTTRGTRQDSSVFYEDMYRKCFGVLLRTVEKLRSIAPLKVIYVKGNHDTLTTFTMLESLKQMYESNNIDNIIIDSSMKQRKYYQFGNVLLGLSHGEKEKNRIYQTMQSEQLDNWKSKYKYFHLSHFHSESKKEVGGVIYQHLGSLSETCKWSYESGFVGSEKKGHVFVYDEEYGLECEIFIKV